MDLAAERTLAEILVQASRDGLVDAAHDLSTGGLAQALVDACLRFGVGARVSLEELCGREEIDVATALFAESGARALVAVPRSEEVRFVDSCVARGFPYLRLGVTDDSAEPGEGGEADEGPSLTLVGHATIPLSILRSASEATLPRRFGQE